MLSGLFYLAAALVWIRFHDRPRRLTYVLALVLFVAGILAKNMVVTLPAALLILQWFRYGRVTTRDLGLVAPFFLVAIAFVALDLSLVSSATPAEFHYSTIERVLIAGRAVWFYAGKLLWPLDLVVIYPHWDAQLGAPLDWPRSTVAVAWGGIAALVAMAVVLWILRSRIGRGPLAGLLFFVITLSPALGFVDHTYMVFAFVADRYQYLASIGLSAVVLGMVAHASTQLPEWPRKGALVLAAGMLLVLGLLTWQQSGIYRNQLTFFTYITEQNPSAVGAHLNLANALRDAGRFEEAEAAGRVAVEQRLDNFDAYGNLVQILIAGGDPAGALDVAREAAERFPAESRAPAHVGLSLVHTGRVDEAEPAFRRAIAIDAEYADARLGLGVVLLSQARYEEALEHLLIATELAPGNAQGWTNAGIALSGLGRHQEAIEAFDHALTLDPHQESARTGQSQARQRIEEGGGR